MTKYLVLKEVEATSGPGQSGVGIRAWAEVGEFDAADGKSAVKAAVLAMSADAQKKASAQTFAATPAQSWREVSPKVETTTVVSFA